jgi:heme/copper-type cytochrome/quinol oxidase subunit 2
MLFASNNLAESSGSFWLPPQSSSYAADIDWLFWFIFAICVIFFLLVAVLVVVFAWKYRYQPGKDPGDAPKHNTALELTWTFVPTVLVVIIFVFGFKGYLRMTVPPPNAYEIIVSQRPSGPRTPRTAGRASTVHLEQQRRDPRLLHAGLPGQKGRRTRPVQ